MCGAVGHACGWGGVGAGYGPSTRQVCNVHKLLEGGVNAGRECMAGRRA